MVVIQTSPLNYSVSKKSFGNSFCFSLNKDIYTLNNQSVNILAYNVVSLARIVNINGTFVVLVLMLNLGTFL